MSNQISSISSVDAQANWGQEDMVDLSSRIQALQGNQVAAQSSIDAASSTSSDATVASFYQAMLAQNPQTPQQVYQYLYKLTQQGKPLSFADQRTFLQGCSTLLKQNGQNGSPLYQVIQKSILTNGMIRSYALDMVTEMGEKLKIQW